MGRAPCCDKANVKKGPWSPEEDIKLKEFVEKYGTGGNWIALPQKAGLKRCGKSCRLRWLNYLRPNIKHGEFSADEDRVICSLFATIGSRWSIIAAQLPGRTDNDIKNYWNTKLKKKLLGLAPTQRKSDPQKQHQQQQIFSSSLETITAPTSTSNGSSYTPQKPLLTGLEGFSIHPDVMNSAVTTPTSTPFHAGPMHHYQVKDNSSLLIFGGEPSSSSSDGSCSQISYGKEIEYEYAGGIEQHMGLESLLFNSTGLIEENQKFLLAAGCGGSDQEERGNGLMWGETSLEYGYEDVKQLINSTSSSNGCTNLHPDDPISAIRVGSYSTQGRMTYYY